MEEKNELDFFGQFLMKNLRDRAFLSYDIMLRNSRLNFLLQEELREKLVPWNAEQQEVVRECIALGIDGAIHDFLFAIAEYADNESRQAEEYQIQILANGVDIAMKSDGLHGELLGKEGWINKYSDNPDSIQ